MSSVSKTIHQVRHGKIGRRLPGLWPNVLKIDVEGFEDLVLKGATETLRRFQPIVFVEFHHDELALRNVSSLDVLALLHQSGFVCRELTQWAESAIPRGHLFKFVAGEKSI